MVSSAGHWVLRQAFWASSCLFLIFGKKNTETQKQDWKKTYLFLVTDRLDHYLACRPAYINLISYINMSIIVKSFIISTIIVS